MEKSVIIKSYWTRISVLPGVAANYGPDAGDGVMEQEAPSCITDKGGAPKVHNQHVSAISK